MENEQQAVTADPSAPTTQETEIASGQQAVVKGQPLDESESDQKTAPDEGDDYAEEEATATGTRVRHRRRRPEPDAAELRLRGRRALC
ncbi:MAG: hypothetical protein L0215_01115 [Gemmataceae bacterium]|nr:hypothetical protein [Gemmataceae bacterium]